MNEQLTQPRQYKQTQHIKPNLNLLLIFGKTAKYPELKQVITETSKYYDIVEFVIPMYNDLNIKFVERLAKDFKVRIKYLEPLTTIPEPDNTNSENYIQTMTKINRDAILYSNYILVAYTDSEVNENKLSFNQVNSIRLAKEHKKNLLVTKLKLSTNAGK